MGDPDEFVMLSNAQLPVNQVSFKSRSIEECKTACLNDFPTLVMLVLVKIVQHGVYILRIYNSSLFMNLTQEIFISKLQDLSECF